MEHIWNIYGKLMVVSAVSVILFTCDSYSFWITIGNSLFFGCHTNGSGSSAQASSGETVEDPYTEMAPWGTWTWSSQSADISFQRSSAFWNAETARHHRLPLFLFPQQKNLLQISPTWSLHGVFGHFCSSLAGAGHAAVGSREQVHGPFSHFASHGSLGRGSQRSSSRMLRNWDPKRSWTPWTCHVNFTASTLGTVQWKSILNNP